MSTPVLATKLCAPTRRPHLVGRSRLSAQLDDGLEPTRRLTVVSAPPGFGKTTLVSEWLRRLEGAPGPTNTGWLSLDDDDNDSGRFLAHLLAAMQGMVDGLAHRSTARRNGAAVLTALVNDLATAGEQTPDQRWVLVLDDYHVIADRDVHDALGFLLEHAPAQLHLVIATRSDPPLSLSRLRTRGQLTEVRAADLRFTPSEAQDFLNRAMGLSLTVADVAALDERTEGWVAGLQLAALSLQGVAAGEVADFIGDFTGSNRFVIDYLADEVLARQTAEVRDFLLRTSALKRLTASLCDAVSERTDSAQLLARLDQGNLFVVALDERREWYRYHHLFADVLHARLLAERPDDVAVLHRRAADWHAAQGLAEDAVRHALAGGDFARAGRLVEEALPRVRRARQDTLLSGWAGALPDDVLRSSPVLSTVAAWARLVAGDLDGVAARLDDAEAALRAGEADESVRVGWADTEDLRTAPAMIEVYRASLAQARGDVGGTVAHARRAGDLAGPDDHVVRGAGAGFLGLAQWAAGDVEQALTTFASAVESLHAAGNLVDELDTTVVLGAMWVAAGRPSRARRLYLDALRAAKQDGEPYPRATPDLHVAIADLDRERGDLRSADAHLEDARVLRDTASITENRHAWSVVAAGVHAARGEHGTAIELLDRAEADYRPGFYPEVRPVASARARVMVAAGDLEGAAMWAEQRGVGLLDDVDYLHEHEHLTLVRLELARGAGNVDAMLSLLDRLATAAQGSGRGGSLVEIRMLGALAHHVAGDVPSALNALGASFAATSEPESYARLYLDEGVPMLELLRHAAARPGELADRAHRLVGSEEVPQPRRPAGQPLVDPLSEREQQVLRMLESELSGPQIARELYVSLNTLRTHTKRIYIKLDVTTRAAAVRRAKEHGLL